MTKNSRINKKLLVNLGVFIALILGFFYVDHEDVFFKKAYGIHFMRQTDGLAFASNYDNNSLNFFEPELYNLKNDEGKAACEFPIIYYLTAIAYKIFGKHYFILKLIHLLTLYVGLLHLFKMSEMLIKDKLLSLILILIPFTSTVFNYYSFNYLPDAPALGFVLSGSYFAIKFNEHKDQKSILYSFMFFSLAGLLKATYFIIPIALFCSALFDFFIVKNKSFPIKKVSAYFFGSILSILAWNIYIVKYNEYYNSYSFNTGILPIWNISSDEQRIVWDHMTDWWYFDYFAKKAWIILTVSAVANVLLLVFKKSKLAFFNLIVAIGSLCYIVLFYSQFKDHDYYMLCVFPLFLSTILVAFKEIKQLKWYFRFTIKSILVVFLFLGVKESKGKIKKRHYMEYDMYSKGGIITGNYEDDILKLNLPKEAKIISVTDFSQNGSLLYLNRKGWLIPSDHDYSEKRIQSYIDSGATHIWLTTKNEEIIKSCQSYGSIIWSNPEVNMINIKRLEATP